MELVVVQREFAAEGVVVLMLRDPRGERLPPWEPGAHIDVIVSPTCVRQYSLCGEPADAYTYRIGVLRETAGRGGSLYIHEQLQVGSRVLAGGPRNHFPLLPSERYLFVAGGIGITPLLPMLAAADAVGAQWRLVYGGRTRSSMAFASELAQHYPGHVEIRPQDECGLLDLDSILQEPEEPSRVYCCGPEPLLSAVERHCSSWSRGVLHVERFSAKGSGEAAPQTEFEVELTLSGKTLTVPGDKSILETLQQANVDVMWGCTDGVCGVCETRVLSGTVDHRDTVLTAEQRAVNDRMMICVSRASCPRLVLEL